MGCRNFANDASPAQEWVNHFYPMQIQIQQYHINVNLPEKASRPDV